MPVLIYGHAIVFWEETVSRVLVLVISVGRLEAMPQTVFVGSHFFPRLEESAEVAGIVETEFVGNFRNIQVGIDK